MPLCKQCNQAFPIWETVAGKKRNLGHRKYCLSCKAFSAKHLAGSSLSDKVTHCRWHLCNHELHGRQRGFCGSSCRNNYFVTQRRKKIKALSVAYKGSKCVICSYDLCLDALSFHHLDQDGKDFGIAASGFTRSWEKVAEELDKCILVCLRCHAEIHAGFHAEVIHQWRNGSATPC